MFLPDEKEVGGTSKHDLADLDKPVLGKVICYESAGSKHDALACDRRIDGMGRLIETNASECQRLVLCC